MKHIHLTWYLLSDGAQADPDDVSPGEDGVLRHKSGVAVAMHENGVPKTVGVTAKATEEATAAKKRNVEAEPPKRHYKTRESRAG